MCFYHDGGIAEFQRVAVVLTRKAHQCGECFREIRARELAQHVSQKYEGDLLSDYYCGECEATRFRVHLMDLAEGCTGNETWCPIGDLANYCDEMKIKRSTHSGGQLYLRKRRRELKARRPVKRAKAAL